MGNALGLGVGVRAGPSMRARVPVGFPEERPGQDVGQEQEGGRPRGDGRRAVALPPPGPRSQPCRPALHPTAGHTSRPAAAAVLQDRWTWAPGRTCAPDVQKTLKVVCASRPRWGCTWQATPRGAGFVVKYS